MSDQNSQNGAGRTPDRPLTALSGASADAAPRRNLNVAVVGLGYWGPNLLRVLHDAEEVTVAYMCDLDPERLERFARRYPAPVATEDFDRILEDPDLDVVVLATPGVTHHGLGSRSLAAGKHTFVEKPLAFSTAEADDLIRLAREHDRTLMCGHTFLFSPAVQAVKRLIDQGELGELYFVSSSRVNLGLHQKDISVIWDLAPHDFSMLRYWLGERPASISSVGRASVVPEVPDVAFVNLSFPSGVVGHVEMSWLAPSKLRRTVLVGSKKMVLYDDTSPEPVKIFDQGVVYRDPTTFGEYHLSYRTGDILSPKLGTWEPLARQLDAFLQAVREGRRMEDHMELARDVVLMLECADRSLDRNGIPQRMVQPGAVRVA